MNETGENIGIDNIAKMQRDGNLSKAIEICQSAIKQDPTNCDLHIRLGDLYLEKHLDIYQPKQFIDDAINEYQIALESDINTVEIYYKLGVTLFYKGNFEKAQNYLEISIEYDEKHYNSYLMLARILAKKNRFAEAQTCLKNSLKYGGFRNSRANYMFFLLSKFNPQKTFTGSIKAYCHLFKSIMKLPFDKFAQKKLLSGLDQ